MLKLKTKNSIRQLALHQHGTGLVDRIIPVAVILTKVRI